MNSLQSKKVAHVSVEDSSPVVVGTNHESLSLYTMPVQELEKLIEKYSHKEDINYEIKIGTMTHFWYELVDEHRWRLPHG